tara:strand:- start:11734 stop:12339 length:606 start_codon:yes stop_codon:yes gene_type:complete
MTLTDIFNEEGGDKGSFFSHIDQTENLAHNYTIIYDEYMKEYRDKNIAMLEIGLWCPYFPGASIRAWSRYFSTVQYYGIDIVDCTKLSSENVFIDIVDQRNENALNSYIKDKPMFKFIIDDGCHEEDAIVISLGNLFPQLESGGIYFIEDLHVVDKRNLLQLVTKTFTSEYISKDKLKYINDNIRECRFSDDGKMCIIHKA